MFTDEWRTALAGFKILFALSQVMFFCSVFSFGLIILEVPTLFAIGVGFWTNSILNTCAKLNHEKK
jgi:hypothetical protein